MNNHNYKEIRVLTSEKLRNLCIKEDWYFYATNNQYNSLVELCNTDNITLPIILEISQRICEHPHNEREHFISVVNKVLAETDTYIEEI